MCEGMCEGMGVRVWGFGDGGSGMGVRGWGFGDGGMGCASVVMKILTNEKEMDQKER